MTQQPDGDTTKTRSQNSSPPDSGEETEEAAAADPDEAAGPAADAADARPAPADAEPTADAVVAADAADADVDAGAEPAAADAQPDADADVDAGAEPAAADAQPDADAAVAEMLAEPEPELSAEHSGAEAGLLAASDLLNALTSLAALGSRVDDIATAAAELARLRTRDTDLIARLHDDVTRLRTGEIAAALNPVVAGLIKLHDQMVSLGALTDSSSPVAMLHTQLLQVMELTCAVRPFTPEPGERFDAARHTGTRRVPVTDDAADGTIARTVKAGFARADGSVVRVAEVEVHRGSG
ncbi:MAG TPA: nucleotide exchange factor GrpE [Streptosporangiaceae bacterium]